MVSVRGDPGCPMWDTASSTDLLQDTAEPVSQAGGASEKATQQ